MSSSRWVTTPSQLLSSYVYFCYLVLISSTSVRSFPFLSFTVLIFAWNVHLVYPMFLKRSLVFPLLLLCFISLHFSLKKASLFLPASLWNSAFSLVYLFLFPLPFHCLPEYAQIHIHWISDAIQPSHPLSSPFPLVLNLSLHYGLFHSVSSSHQVAKVFGASAWVLLIYLGLISFRIEWFDLLVHKGLSRVFFSTTIQKHQSFSTQPSLWSNSHIMQIGLPALLSHSILCYRRPYILQATYFVQFLRPRTVTHRQLLKYIVNWLNEHQYNVVQWSMLKGILHWPVDFYKQEIGYHSQISRGVSPIQASNLS